MGENGPISGSISLASDKNCEIIREKIVNGAEWIELLPQGFVQASGERGCIVKWAPQKQVLAHDSVGGFWSHCGWNSTLESTAEGVPMICKPCVGDQIVNARYASRVWKIGLHNSLEREEVEVAVRRLMVDKEGKERKGNEAESNEFEGED